MTSDRPLGRRLAAPVTAACAALALAACGTGGTSGGSGNTNFVSGKSGIARASADQRGKAPELKGESLQGKPIDVAKYRGKVVVLNVWGSWCPPCRLEAKHFAKVSKETADQGVQFIGIDTRDPRIEPAVEFEKNFGITYPSIHDPAGRLMLRFPKGTLNPSAIPSTVVLDREGRLAARTLRPMNEKTLHEMIDPLIAEK